MSTICSSCFGFYEDDLGDNIKNGNWQPWVRELFQQRQTRGAYNLTVHPFE